MRHFISFAEVGGPEVLTAATGEIPTVETGRLLVEVRAAGLNYIDTYHRTGIYPVELPFIPGLDGAGVVLEVGPGVDGFQPGDHVVWPNEPGTYTSHHLVNANRAIKVPEGVSSAAATAAMIAGMTAHYLVTDTFALGPADTCLVHAGAGGVGLLLTQMAKMAGATVVTTVSTTEKEAMSRDAGADHVIRYTESDFVEESRRLLERDRPYDVIYDSVGKSTFLPGLGLIRKRGMMVLFGQSSGVVDDINPGVLAQNGSLFLTRPTLFDYIVEDEAFRTRAGQVLDWIQTGELQVTVGGEFDLANAADAHRALEARQTTGKVILVP
jgi:NADPH2:quinone reductase